MEENTYCRPSWDEYFLGLMDEVGKRGTCDRGRSGCVVVRGKQIVCTGYVGSPEGFPHCDEVGHLMKEVVGEDGKSGMHCMRTIHAEQNAILAAARFGIATEGAVLYSTMQPCFGCTKELLQAGVRGVYYLHEWAYPDPQMQASYAEVQAQFADGVREVEIEDEQAAWAISRIRKDG